MHRSLAIVACLALVACKKKEDKPAPPAPAKPTAPADPAAPPSVPSVPSDKPMGKPAPPPSDAPVDPAAFVPADVSGIKALAKVAIKAPPGAIVTADEPPYGESAPAGATLTQGSFVLHLWHGTMGGERSTLPMRPEIEGKAGGKYIETTSTPDLLEYTFDFEGVKTYGYIMPVEAFTELGDQILCGNAKPVATPEALAPYRAACATAGKK